MEFVFPIDLSLEGPCLLLLVFFPHVSQSELLCSNGTMCLLAVEHQETNKALCTGGERVHGEVGSLARFDVLFFSFFISEETTVMLFLSNMDFEVLFPKCDKSMHFRE